MRRAWPLLMVALVSLFLAEGQRALFASLFAFAHDALFPSLRPADALVAMLPLLVVLAPLLPLARWLDRGAAVAAAAMGTALFRLLMTSPSLGPRLVGGGLVVACSAIFLTWAVGHLDRRALAGGVVVGLAVDQMLRLSGSGYDLSLQPAWAPVQVALSLALIGVVVFWARTESADRKRGGGRTAGDSGSGLERRTGGLRLRGGLAFGALLFMDLHVLGLPPVVARWTGVGYPAAGMAVGLASAAAVAATLLLGRPSRGRTGTLALVALATAGALVGYWADGSAVAGLMAAGHFAALVLVTRALEPASGRRSGATVAVGFVLFALATTAYALTFYGVATFPALDGGAPWIFGGVGLLLAACFILLPRPETIPAPASWAPAGTVAVLVALAAVGFSLSTGRGAGAAAGTASHDGRVRVATWDVRYGFDEEWRFDPAAMAGAIRTLDADVVAIRRALVGSPTAYGMDLPLWLERRTGLRSLVAPDASSPIDAAILTRLAGRAEGVPWPRDGGDGQLIRLRAPIAGTTVAFVAVPAGEENLERAASLRAAVAATGGGAAVVLGDAAGDESGARASILGAAGFRDFASGAVWARGLRPEGVAGPYASPPGHRAVVATLHILEGRIRSTDANDLQTP